jgi:hypothetical protein
MMIVLEDVIEEDEEAAEDMLLSLKSVDCGNKRCCRSC